MSSFLKSIPAVKQFLLLLLLVSPLALAQQPPVPDPNAGNMGDPNAGNMGDPNAGNTGDPNAGNMGDPNAGNMGDPNAGNAVIIDNSSAPE